MLALPRTMAELCAALTELRAAVGSPSYAELTRRVHQLRRDRGLPEAEAAPGRVTVYDCFRATRRRVDVELLCDIAAALGGDPGWWRQAHAAVSGVNPATAAVVVHAWIPEPDPIFIGRDAELTAIVDGQWHPSDEARSCAPPGHAGAQLTVVTGMAGIGKTQLILRAAGAIVANDPRMQPFFVDLHSYDVSVPQATPGAVLRALLRALEVRGDRIAVLDDDGCARLYRRLTGDRDLVLLLDNAGTCDQLAPLLPSGSRSHVLVTSRRRLELAGARQMTLDPLSVPASVRLLSRYLGSERVRAESESAAELARLGAGLPLCLSVTASRIARQDGWTLGDHVQRLTQLPQAEVVDHALGLSWQQLDEPAARMLELLTLHPGTPVSADAAQALLGGPADAPLQQLTAEHLISFDSDHRAVLHDLVRAFAERRCTMDVPATAQRQAMLRLGAHFAGLAQRPGPSIDWLTADGAAATATVRWLAEHEEPDAAAQLATMIGPHLVRTGQTCESESVHTLALRARDDGLRALAHLDLGDTYERVGRFVDAEQHLRSALDLFVDRGDAHGELRARKALGNVCKRSGRYHEALARYADAGALAERLDDRAQIAAVLANRADTYRLLGLYSACATASDEALQAFTELGALWQVSGLHRNLVLLHLRVGDIDAARRHLDQARRMDTRLGQVNAHTAHVTAELTREEGDWARTAEAFAVALELARDQGDLALEGSCLNGLGESALATGDLTGAADSFANALALADRIGDREVTVLALHGQSRVSEGSQQAVAHSRALVLAEQLEDPYLLELVVGQPEHRGVTAG